MTPYYQDEWCTIYHGDCREILPELPKVDLVLTDPPYGINWVPRVNNRDGLWADNARPDIKPLIVGSNHCIWGGNYFTDQLPVTESWLIWIKRPSGYNFDDDNRTYSVCEMAWSDYGNKPKMKHHVWDGGLRAGDTSNREFNHPAQKPLEIMKWCIVLAPNEPKLILDPYMGSGTTLRAAKDLNRHSIGIEIEEKYCEIAAKRCSQGVFDMR